MTKLTKRVVDAAEVRRGDYFIWDGDLPGFGLRVFPSGRKRYIVQYRAGRRSRRISLGPSTVLTCEQARSQAIAILAATRNGDDPAALRKAGRNAITVRELAERFDNEHVALRLKAAPQHRMFADHKKERQDAPDAELDPTNGWCLCGAHHSLKTAREREKRLLKG